MSRISNIGVIVSVAALMIAAGVAWTMNVDATDPFAYDYDLGTYQVDEGQTMTIDLGAIMEQRMGTDDHDVITNIDVSADSLPSWISVSDDGRTLTIKPVAPAALTCNISAVIDVARGTGSYQSTHSITFSIIAVADSSAHSGTVYIDAGDGVASWSSATISAGERVVLPGCDAAGGDIFTGWFTADGERLGNAGDVIDAVNGQVIVAGYAEDPNYVAPGEYDWTITLVIVAALIAVIFACWKYGSAEKY